MDKTTLQPVLPPFYNFTSLTYPDITGFPDGLAQLQAREVDGFWIRNVLSPEEVASLVNFTFSVPDEQKINESQGWVYPTGFAAAVEEAKTEEEIRAYFRSMEAFRKQSIADFGFDYVERVEEILRKMSGGRPVSVPAGLGGEGAFTPVQIRLLYAGHPGIPIHCGNVFRQMYPGYYGLLSEKVNPVNSTDSSH